MAAVIVVFVFQIFMFGYISADCVYPSAHCNECKEISSGPFTGIWTLKERNSHNCSTPGMCLYQDIENNSSLACMCDPGAQDYTDCGLQFSKEYLVRKGDCPGNDIIPVLYNTTLAECTQYCNSLSECEAFMLFNETTCFPKTKSCATTNTTNPLNWFYSKTVWEGGLCYNDTALPKLYSKQTSMGDNSIEYCRLYCSNQLDAFNQPYTYIGLGSTEDGNGIYCYCGNTDPPTEIHPIVDPYNCNVNCLGNFSQTCGGINFDNNNIFINVWTVYPIHV